MKLVAGSQAPDFSVEDVWGNSVRLHDYEGKWVLLSFFRFASCVYCNVRVSQLIGRAAAYRAAGLELMAVFESPRGSLLRSVGRQQPPFPLIADPDNGLYAPYGVETSKLRMLENVVNPLRAARLISGGIIGLSKGFLPGKADGKLARMPADFLIAPGRVLAAVHYGHSLGDHLPFTTVDQHLGLAGGRVMHGELIDGSSPL